MEDKIRFLIREEINKIFLFEEKGVPEEVIKAVTLIEPKIKELYLSIEDTEWSNAKDSKENPIVGVKKFEDYCDVESSEGFFRKIRIDADFIKVFDGNISDEIIFKSNRGIILGDSIKFNPNTKRVNVATISINFCFRANNENPDFKSLLYHELLHLYEIYQRELSGASLFNSKDYLFNGVKKLEIRNPIMEKLVHLIYCLLSFENNAFISGLYGELMHSRADSIKNIEDMLYKTYFYKEFAGFLKEPEKIITKGDIEKINIEDLNAINEIIKKEAELANFKDFNKFDLYYRGDKQAWINKLFAHCKKTYAYLMKKAERVIEKVNKDKNPSLIKEQYEQRFLDGWVFGDYLY